MTKVVLRYDPKGQTGTVTHYGPGELSVTVKWASGDSLPVYEADLTLAGDSNSHD